MSAWARAGAASLVLLLGAASRAGGQGPLGAGAPLDPAAQGGPAPGDTLAGRRVAEVTVLTRNIYDPLPSGPLVWAYRLVNRLHVRTHPEIVRKELLVRPGDPWNPERGEESARQLRALGYIDTVSVEARPSGDEVSLRVNTRDAWSTALEVNVQGGGGEGAGSAAFGERNFLGRGKAFSLAYKEEPRNISRSAWLEDPNVLGSRWRVATGAARGSQGSSAFLRAGLPFYAQDAPLSYGADAQRAVSHAELFRTGELAATFEQRVEELEAWWGIGRRSGSTLVRWIQRFYLLDRRFGPSSVEPDAPVEFQGGEERLRIRRLGSEVDLWTPHYVQRRYVEHLDRIEDFDLGTRLAVQAGLAPRFLGSTADEGYGRVQLALGGGLDPASFWRISLRASTRARLELRETLLQAEGRFVHQGLPRHTVVLAGWGAAAAHPARPTQFVLGGLSGVRGFDAQQITGRQAVRVNLEDRVFIARQLGQVLSLGTAAFVDGARAWGPGADGVGWYVSAGFGLRASLPRSGWSRVARIDVAWPIAPSMDGRHAAVLSFGSSQAF